MSEVIEFRSRREPRPPLPPSRLHLSEPMPRWWTDEDQRLQALPYDDNHTPSTDYDLVRLISMGRRLADVAFTTGMPVPLARARWNALVDPLRDASGLLPVEAQARLLQVLRHRALHYEQTEPPGAA